MSLTNRAVLILATIILLLKGCATPMAPTGGEPDRSGPEIVETEPASGTVNYSSDEIQFTFDKFVDRSSFRQNISLEPDLGIELDVSFSRKKATVSFTSTLPENTTVAVRVGGDVTDTNRNKMGNPVTVAVSTGPELDDGKITAQVIDARTGEREGGQRVFLYRDDADLTQRAIYTAETDTSGRVEFGFIGEGIYSAFWINDLNRNRIWDRQREQAQPFYVERFEIARNDSVHIGTLFVSTPDTVSPKIEGVGLLSERRLRLRFSEPIEFNSESYFSVTDTLKNEVNMAYPLYISEDDPSVLFAQSSDALDENEMYTLTPFNLKDDAGNELEIAFEPFQGSSEPDTTRLMTVSHNTGSGLFPTEAVEVKFTKFIDDNSVLDSLRVIEGDRVIDDWEFAEIERNILRIMPDSVWQSGVTTQFRVWNPWEQEREVIEPEIWQSNQLGSIELSLVDADSSKTSYVRLQSDDESIRVDTTFTQMVEVDNLPPLSYRITVFEDTNENGRWDTGTVEPYSSPEPYAIRRNIPVREGFASEVELIYPLNEIQRGPETFPMQNNETEQNPENLNKEQNEGTD